MDRQAGCVGSDDGAGLADGLDAREKGALDFEIFGDGFDNPVHLATPAEIVFKIAAGDQACGVGREERRGTGFFCGFEAGGHDSIPNRWTFKCQTFACLVRYEIPRNDIEQITRDARVGKVSSNPRTHRSGSQHSDFFNPSFHWSAQKRTSRLQNEKRRVNLKDRERPKYAKLLLGVIAPYG